VSTLRWFLARYDRRSVWTALALVLGYVAIGALYNRYLDLSRGMDWLLLGIWLYMTAVLCWAIEPRRDVVRAVVGLGAGLFIEGWGTITEIWHYFTAERPPLWIIPAWPVAALAIDRMSKGVEHVLTVSGAGPRALRVLWWAMMPPFTVYFAGFAWHTVDLFATQFAFVCMGVVLIWPGRLRQDVALFIAGAGLGIFLEYWGTSRHCWTYYTGEIPPTEAILAHGFAAVAFQRAADVVEWGLDRTGLWPGSPTPLAGSSPSPA
jgi:hypothetical protein